MRLASVRIFSRAGLTPYDYVRDLGAAARALGRTDHGFHGFQDHRMLVVGHVQLGKNVRLVLGEDMAFAVADLLDEMRLVKDLAVAQAGRIIGQLQRRDYLSLS